MPHHIVSPFVPPKKYGSKGGEPWQLVARRVYYGLVAWCFSPSFKPPCSTGGVSGVDYDYNGYNDAMAMTTAMVMATTTAAKAGVTSSACRPATRSGIHVYFYFIFSTHYRRRARMMLVSFLVVMQEVRPARLRLDCNVRRGI
jgi:hypothetical protein